MDARLANFRNYRPLSTGAVLGHLADFGLEVGGAVVLHGWMRSSAPDTCCGCCAVAQGVCWWLLRPCASPLPPCICLPHSYVLPASTPPRNLLINLLRASFLPAGGHCRPQRHSRLVRGAEGQTGAGRCDASGAGREEVVALCCRDVAAATASIQ